MADHPAKANRNRKKVRARTLKVKLSPGTVRRANRRKKEKNRRKKEKNRRKKEKRTQRRCLVKQVPTALPVRVMVHHQVMVIVHKMKTARRARLVRRVKARSKDPVMVPKADLTVNPSRRTLIIPRRIRADRTAAVMQRTPSRRRVRVDCLMKKPLKRQRLRWERLMKNESSPRLHFRRP
jgi:hypothetical protein